MKPGKEELFCDGGSGKPGATVTGWYRVV